MGTVTAYPDPIHGYVYLEVDWSDQPALTQARVFRVIVATGEEALVRVHTATDGTGEPIILNGGVATLYDTEAPLDVLIYYRTEATGFTSLGVINTNPYFEIDTSDWSVVASNTIARSTVQSHQGVASLLVTPTGGATAGAVTSRYPVTLGESYTVTGWFRSQLGWPVTSLGVVWRDGGGTSLSTSQVLFALVAATWTFQIVVVIAPPNAVTGELRVRQEGTPAATDFWYADELKFEGPLSGIATSSQVILASSMGLWLKDPLRPYNDRRIVLRYNGSTCVPGKALYFSGLADESYGNRGDLPVVVNKRNPIAVTRTRGGMTSTLGLVSRTFLDRDLLKETLAPGSVLFLQAPSKYGIEDTYMAIGDVDIGRMSNDMRQQWRQFKIPFVEADRPAGLMFGTLGSRWMDMCDVYATFAAATAAGISWYDVMQGAAGAPGDGIVAGWATWSSVVGQYATWTDVVAGNATWIDLVEG
jgi:hypothetical protein